MLAVNPSRLAYDVLLATSLGLICSGIANGQSGDRYAPTQGYGGPVGSGDRAGSDSRGGSGSRSPAQAQQGQVALRGFCPVCLVEMKQWVRGNPQFSMQHDGKVYYFPEQKQLEMFQASPEKYAPALGGDCVVHFVNTGQRVPGRLDFGVRHEGRVFFLDSPQHKQEFMTSPDHYANADLALGGNCVVCQVDMNQAVPGSPQVNLVHNGMRFQFAGADQQAKFMAQPAKYLPAASTPSQGSRTRGGGGGSEQRGSGQRLPAGSSSQGSGQR